MRNGQRVSMSPVESASAVEHREPLAIVELPAERRRRLAHRDAARGAFAAHFDIDDARFLALPHAARRLPCSRGAPSRDNTKCVATVAWPTKLPRCAA